MNSSLDSFKQGWRGRSRREAPESELPGASAKAERPRHPS